MPRAMKATRYKKELAHKHIDHPWIVEPKIDGMRMHAFIDAKDNVVIKSYANKVMDYWEGVFDKAIIKFVRKGLQVRGPYVLDGEAKVRKGTFQDTMSAKAEDADKSSLVYWVFDHMTMKEWALQECYVHQYERTLQLADARKFLAKLHRGKSIGNIDVLPYSQCETHNLKLAFEQALRAGHEGIVAKRMDSLYEWKRSKNWLKMKQLNTYDGRIVAIHEGEGKFKGMAGSITIEGTIDDENETPFETNVNLSTNEVREDFWKNRKKFIGRTVEVAAQEPSFKVKRGIVAALRHSKYIRLREKDDK